MQVTDFIPTEPNAVEKRLGTFVFDDPDPLPMNPIELEDGSIYIGEWNEEGERHGRGVQFWPNGSKYEGYWQHNAANGRGRLVHSDGDVYEG
jgi:hypothetical protein